MFPTEVITMLTSAVVGSVLKIWAMKTENDQKRWDSNRKDFDKAELSRERASHVNHAFSSLIRLLIVGSAITALVGPILLPALMQGISTEYIYGEVQGRWFGGIVGPAMEKIRVIKTEAGSLTILPMHTHTLSAIVGFYFGAEIKK